MANARTLGGLWDGVMAMVRARVLGGLRGVVRARVEELGSSSG